jgi:hypothetical protein
MKGSGPSSLLWLSMPFSRARDGEWLGGRAAGVKSWGMRESQDRKLAKRFNDRDVRLIICGDRLSTKFSYQFFTTKVHMKEETSTLPEPLKHGRQARHVLIYIIHISSTQREIARTNSGWWVFPGPLLRADTCEKHQHPLHGRSRSLIRY